MRIIIQIGFIVVAVLAGIFSKSIWVGLLVAGGFLVMILPITQSVGGFFIRSFLGIGLLGIAAWYSEFSGGWLWTAIWLLAALSIYMIGTGSKKKVPQWLSTVKMIIAVFLIVIAVVSPFIIQGNYSSEGFLGWVFGWFIFIVGSFFLFTLNSAKKIEGGHKLVIKIGFFLVLGIAVIGAFVSNSIWVPFLVMPGLLLLFKNWQRWVEGAFFNWGVHLLTMLGGIALLVAGTIIANFQTSWFWTTVWVIASIPQFVMGSLMFEEEHSDRSTFFAGVFSLVLGVCSLVFALTGTFILKDLPWISATIIFILIAAGLLVLILSWDRATANANLLAVLLGVAGTVLLLGAQVYNGFPEGWVWIVLWAIGIILMVVGVFSVRSIIVKIFMLLIALTQLLIIFRGRNWYENYLVGNQTLDLSKYALIILIVLGSLVLLVALGFGIFMTIRLRQVSKIAKQPSVFGSQFDTLLMGMGKYMQEEEEKKKNQRD